MTPFEFQEFHEKLVDLCQKYGIWIAERKDWKERPNATCQFVDFLLRAKIEEIKKNG